MSLRCPVCGFCESGATTPRTTSRSPWPGSFSSRPTGREFSRAKAPSGGDKRAYSPHLSPRRTACALSSFRLLLNELSIRYVLGFARTFGFILREYGRRGSGLYGNWKRFFLQLWIGASGTGKQSARREVLVVRHPYQNIKNPVRTTSIFSDNFFPHSRDRIAGCVEHGATDDRNVAFDLLLRGRTRIVLHYG
jgi:hypothetical protein